MKHLDLFTGIAGFTLAAQWSGMETVAVCEINKWCYENAICKITKAPNLVDIRNVKGKFIHERFGDIDIITAGVPCQPSSIIGKRKGTTDGRWLWPETFRVIGETSPTWVICEQPTGILSLDGGERFTEILREFQEAGYSVWWETIPASAVGAGHRRERVWITAYASSKRLEGYSRNGNTYGRQERKEEGEARPATQKTVFPVRNSKEWWKDQSPVPIVVDGLSGGSFYREKIEATGNAIVPQVAYTILKGIASIEHSLSEER